METEMKDVVVVDMPMSIEMLMDVVDTLHAQVDILSHCKKFCFCTECSAGIVVLKANKDSIQQFINMVLKNKEEIESLKKAL